jgi:hypothetical protein
MTDDLVPFASRTYGLLFTLLLTARGVDFLSTWIATPNMVLEGNPIAKKLGWRWGMVVNLALCFGFAFWEMPAVVLSTTSFLVAARNFQSAWLMHSLGEYAYREWHIARVQETTATLFLFCLFGQTALIAAIGVAVMYFTGWDGNPVLLAIGLGIIAYTLAVLVFTLLGLWSLRRATLREARRNGRACTGGDTTRFQAGSELAPPVCSGQDLETPGK